MTQQIIYVVTEGEYSDYRIIAVYDEAHKDAAYALADSDTYREVEEYVLNQRADMIRQGYRSWIVHMLRNGDVTVAYGGGIYDAGFELYGEGSKELRATVWAKDKQIAIKIVNERRAQMIASGEWMGEEQTND